MCFKFQVWRWLFEKKHSISANDRPKILQLFKATLYSHSEEQFEESCVDLVNNELVAKYTNLVAYIESVFEIQDAWAICFRRDLKIRGCQTNNAVECMLIILFHKCEACI